MSAIVVGRGIVGLAVAMGLADAGVEVQLVGPPASRGAASLAAGAMLGAFGEVTATSAIDSEAAERTARERAHALYAPWVARLSEEAATELSVRLGTFVVANSVGRRDMENLLAIEQAAEAAGAPCERVAPADVPWLRPSPDVPVLGALYLPAEGFVDPVALIGALERVLPRLPNVVTRDASVAELTRDGDACTGVLLDDGTHLNAPMTVLCAGTGCDALLRDALGTRRLRIVGGKGSSVTFAPGGPDAGPVHVIRTPNREFACGVHVVPQAGGAFYLGATNRTSMTPGMGDGASGGELHGLLHAGIHELNTAIRTATISEVRHGYRPLVTDGHPMVGTIAEGLAIATGTYRNGILLAPLIAEWVAQLVTEQREAPCNPFAPSRREELRRASRTATAQVVEAGAKELLAFSLNPHGRLPYDRERELTNVLVGLARAATEDDDDARALRDELRSMVDEFPCPEVMGAVFYRLANGV